MAESVTKNTLSAVPEGQSKDSKYNNPIALRSSKKRAASFSGQSSSIPIKVPKGRSSLITQDCIALRTRSHFTESTTQSAQSDRHTVEEPSAVATTSKGFKAQLLLLAGETKTDNKKSKANINQNHPSTSNQSQSQHLLTQANSPKKLRKRQSNPSHQVAGAGSAADKHKSGSIKKKTNNIPNLYKNINLGARLVRSNDGGSSSGVEESGYGGHTLGESSSHTSSYNHQTIYDGFLCQ